jgi:sulfur carrier protein ThiS
VTIGSALQRHVPCPPVSVQASTVREALEQVFAREPRLRGYLLDDQGVLRRHMAVFVNGNRVKDRRTLADPVSEGEVSVLQALSGG